MQDKKKDIYSLFKFKSVERVSTADTTCESVASLYNGNRIPWIWTMLAMEMCTYQHVQHHSWHTISTGATHARSFFSDWLSSGKTL